MFIQMCIYGIMYITFYLTVN